MTLKVIKIGGNVLESPLALARFLDQLAVLEGPKILVHGGGKLATSLASKLGIPTKMVEGRRITDPEMLQVVIMVYGGQVNKDIVVELGKRNCLALGLTGADAAIIVSKKRPVGKIDYGMVGDVKKVNGKILHGFLEMGLTPVIAPLTFDFEHGLLNTNADTQASEIAREMATNYEVELIYCFEKKGVLYDVADERTVIPEINLSMYQQLKEQGKIFEGMIPKLDNAFLAIERGIKKVIICHADDLLLSVEKLEAGTRLVP